MRWDVHYVAETASTNTDLLGMARAGAPAGTVLRAGHQTAGRGRLGRTWQDRPGSCLLASILLDAEPVPFVTMARVALAATEACRELSGVQATLKWPNDLLVGDRKLAGLLAETDSGSTTVAVGIGCNVDWPPPGERPDDLRDLVAALSEGPLAAPTPARLLRELLERLDGWLVQPPLAVLDAYRTRCSTLGRDVRVALATGAFEGTATGITPSGELEVARRGRSERVSAGDVVHVRRTGGAGPKIRERPL